VVPEPTRDAALQLDAEDPLAPIKQRFALPDKVIYLDGNSLGAMPANVPTAMDDALRRQWGTDLIGSWNANGWWTLPGRVGDRIGRLVGARPGQVMCGDSTSVQLFQALVALARINPHRHTLITDAGGFPTDQYLAESVARMLDLRLLRIAPDALDEVLDEDTAVVALGAVDYRTGERWDATTITAEAHRAGALVLWDLAHAAGVVPFDLDGLGVDAAVGCSYKYLNGGPGAPAWIYLPKRHQVAADLPLTGWHGHATPFRLDPSFTPAEGIERTRIGTPQLLSMLALDAALDVFDDVTMDAVRTKSLALTQLVIDFVDAALPRLEIVTPRGADRRGGQVALRHRDAYAIVQALIARGVIGDFREPDIVRLGFAPLYLSHADVWDAMSQLQDVVESGAYRDPAFAERANVT
jgi:kynureninase